MDAKDLQKWIEWLREQETAAKRDLEAAEHRYDAAQQAREGAEKFLALMPDVPISLPPDDLPTTLDEPPAWQKATGRAKVRPKRPPRRRQSGPRGSEALELVFKESPGKVWTMRSLLAELEQRGWAPQSEKPLNAVRSNMIRTLELLGDQIERVIAPDGHHEFIYHPPEQPSANGQGTAGVGIASVTLAADRTNEGVPS